MHKPEYLVIIISTVLTMILSMPVLSDSAVAWKIHQAGSNPLLELGLFVLGVFVFFLLLGWLNRYLERKKKSKKQNKKTKK
ncbi:MAG: uncharacterized BrkB/YihY/UPF0761 family membrane protein [Halioglobus sp.]|jgi:uncharacterized BrkB/YihY/UPF0761 family membrane protein